MALRIRVSFAFAAAFVAGSMAIFGAASLAGLALRDVPLALRASVAAAALIALAIVDVVSIRRKTYCPIGPKRQTPKTLGRRLGAATTAAAWGFDTGLVVTTFRVGAVTWGALVMTAAGLSPWWIGIGYGVAFVAPLFVLMVTRAPDAPAASLGVTLQRVLARRGLVQAGSGAALLCAGALLIALRVV